jgi:hypothetical protein
LHAKPQVLAAHVAVALVGTAHAFPQPPQFSGSFLVSMHAPPQTTLPPSHICPEPVLAAADADVVDAVALVSPPAPPPPVVAPASPPVVAPVVTEVVCAFTQVPASQMRPVAHSLSFVQPPSSDEQAATRLTGARKAPARRRGVRPRRAREVE